MTVRYPDIHRITREADGTNSRLIRRSALHGRRVSVEQNPQMKFMMMFTLLDLVPVEALDDVHSIAEVALLRDWQHAARFPALPQLPA